MIKPKWWENISSIRESFPDGFAQVTAATAAVMLVVVELVEVEREESHGSADYRAA